MFWTAFHLICRWLYVTAVGLCPWRR